MQKDGFYTEKELKTLNLKYIGKNVLISKKCSIYNSQYITIGNNVRVDDFSLLSGKIDIGDNVHIAAFCGLYAGDVGIEMRDFSGLAAGVCLHAISDDFSGNYLTNPTIPDKYKNIKKGKIVLEKHSLIGSGSRVLPNVIVREGAAVGAMSLLTKSTESWTIYMGVPAKPILMRKKKILELEQFFLKENH